MKTMLLIVIGISIVIEGFWGSFYSSYVLFPSSEPPMMRPIEGMNYVLFVYRQAFLYSGIIGVFVTITGIILFCKERSRKKDMRKEK